MSMTIAVIQRGDHTTPTTLQALLSALVLPRQDADPTDVPSVSAAGPSSIDIDTITPTPNVALRTTLRSITTSAASATNASETCSADSECGLNQACKNQICVNISDGSPIGGPSSEPTSHMKVGTAVGLGIAIVVLLALIVVGFVFLRLRSKQRPNASIEVPPDNRTRSVSSATGWTHENDQKTLVGSLPNSPQNANFSSEQNEMAPALFAKALDVIEPDKEKEEEPRRQTSLDDTRSISTMKALPQRPLPDSPPRTPAKERYALNVNINKSMIFDEDMRRAVSPSISSECETPRRRAPRYQFEEVLPSTTTTPRLSISQPPALSKRSSEYEPDRHPKANLESEAAAVEEESMSHEEPRSPRNVPLPRDSIYDEAGSQNSLDESIARESFDYESGPQSPREEALARLESKAPQIEAPLPSPSFSFRSYDWYQDIIGDSSRVGSPTTSIPSRSPSQTPVTATFPPSFSPSSSPRLSAITASLFPEPPSTIGGPPVSPSYLHPNSALSSPTTASFRLSPIVYQMPSPRSRPLPSPLLLDSLSARNSRSWLPEDGLYLPGEGSGDTFEMFTRSGSKPSIYSPLN